MRTAFRRSVPNEDLRGRPVRPRCFFGRPRPRMEVDETVEHVETES